MPVDMRGLSRRPHLARPCGGGRVLTRSLIPTWPPEFIGVVLLFMFGPLFYESF